MKANDLHTCLGPSPHRDASATGASKSGEMVQEIGAVLPIFTW